jgi:TonB-dependent SusC/RagA subfamily outer membrane receptor
MKRIIVLMLLACFIASPASAQNRKKERELRRELRRLERAAKDSLSNINYFDAMVNVGYGQVKRSDLTTSVSTVDIKQNDVAGYTDIGEYLQGKVPGLSVTKSGDGYKYTIRGINSINSSTDPLFIVDGVEVTDISYLNPRDIKSVDVLKDASASIYGTRGGCGVILISTVGPSDK